MVLSILLIGENMNFSPWVFLPFVIIFIFVVIVIISMATAKSRLRKNLMNGMKTAQEMAEHLKKTFNPQGQQNKNKVCSYCGSKIKIEDEKCPSCGARSTGK